MSHFLNVLGRIKRDLNDPRNNCYPRMVLINHDDLCEALDHFERIDSYARAQVAQSTGAPLEEILYRTIEAMFHDKKKNSEMVMLVIMDVMHRMLEEKYKHENPFKLQPSQQGK